MRAVILSAYNSPVVIKELSVPRPKAGEVLIQTRAVSVNDFDWSLIRGEPYVYRLLFGLLKPKRKIPGIELAGVVEAVGSEVSTFKPGDAVYGDISETRSGAFAEYVCVKQDALHAMSEKMTFEEAAALPHAAMLAFQGLVDLGKIQKGEKVLINGGGGGVGTLGLQIARMYDAEVTGVDSAEKLNMMKSIGFDFVIDYKQEDFTQGGKRYDLILDTKTTRPPAAYQKVLTSKGRYVTVGGSPARLIQLLLAKLAGQTNKHIVALKPNKDLAYINALFDAGRIKPVIDGPYNFDQVAMAIQHFGEGRHRGKVILTV